MAYTKIKIYEEASDLNKDDMDKIDFLKEDYSKSNFKEIYTLIINNISQFIFYHCDQLRKILKALINKTIEKRTRLKRSNPRQVKSSRNFINSSTVPRREKGYLRISVYHGQIL